MHKWTLNSWQEKYYAQGVTYPDKTDLEIVLKAFTSLPALVSVVEILQLKDALRKVILREGFIIQGGDCAESFNQQTDNNILSTVKLLVEQGMIAEYFSHKNVTLIGRMAGLYAKPRSVVTETKGEIALLNYRGDMINKQDFDPEARIPQPALLQHAYGKSLITLNYIREIQHKKIFLEDKTLAVDDYLTYQSPLQTIYASIVKRTADELLKKQNLLDKLFVSREAVLLEYEQNFTREVNGVWYNLATHFPWIGMRTADINGAHVEYFRGIGNPIALKIGPAMQPETLLKLITRLNPDNEPGRLTLIHRIGVDHVGVKLPLLIKAVMEAGFTVVWICDPMHGNTKITNDIKTCHFKDILSELVQSYDIHEALGSYLGGIHLEMTGDDVTECLSGFQTLTTADLTIAYKSPIDPRLNKKQTLDLMFLYAIYCFKNDRELFKSCLQKLDD